MEWQQITDPFNNIVLSALVAVLPVLFIFWALIIKRMKGYKASLVTALIALVIAIFIYKMPPQLALASAGHGALYGLFPISWIIVNAVFFFNLTVKSGQFEVIKHSLATVTTDRRLQALLIAFSFGSFLEGMAGFGTPVAITAAMLVGLGFNPLYAAGICLIANTAPVAFGSIGIPITVASQVSGLPEMAISKMVGRTLPFLSLILPFYLVVLMAGFKKAVEVLPAIFVCGASFAFFQWLSSNYLGPMLPDVIAGVMSIISLIILLRFWRPVKSWHFKEEPPVDLETQAGYSGRQVFMAWLPFLVLTVFILCWGIKPVKNMLDELGMVSFEFPLLHNAIRSADTNLLMPQVFKFNFLSTPGTAILLATLVTVPLSGMKYKNALKIFLETVKQLKIAFLSVSAVLAFAYILNNSGITLTMAAVLSNTGFLFPFFSPVLGWLGVFITGSDTSSNALFSKLQHSAASDIGINPLIAVSANVSGGVIGKMISPQSIAVAAAAGSLIGQESKLFRFTVKHSFIMLVLICLLTLLQAYVLTWLVS